MSPVHTQPVCVRCAARGTSCCISVEGIDGPPLTAADEARIAAASGMRPEQFVVEREVDSVEEEAWAGEDPGLRGVVRRGLVRSLARAADEATCLFLGAAGCTLGAARPLACRRFPFQWSEGGIAVRPAGHCLAVEEAADLQSLLVLLGSSRAAVKRVEAALRRELAAGAAGKG